MNNSIVTEKDLFPYRPIPFYFITTTDPKELTYEKFYESLSDMKTKGFGGVFPLTVLLTALHKNSFLQNSGLKQ